MATGSVMDVQRIGHLCNASDSEVVQAVQKIFTQGPKVYLTSSNEKWPPFSL